METDTTGTDRTETDRAETSGATTARPPAALASDMPAAPGPWQRQFLEWAEHIARVPDLFVAADPAMLRILADATAAATSPATVLIGGPSGAGKEMLARHVHRLSPRRAGPFVAVNCAALPETMIEALLFGHERGSFTGASATAQGLVRAAAGGTLFLDEIGELPLPLQAKLLRVLQEREVLPLGAIAPVAVDLRVVAASNRDLFAEVEAGRFREDLLWRIAVFPLALPPLAARPADIVPLAAALLLRHAGIAKGMARLPTEAALATLAAHDWPGNVRQLDNVLQRALILAGDGPLETWTLRMDAAPGPAPAAPSRHPAADALVDAVRAREAETIHAALRETHGRRAQAAARLGISERTLRYKLAAIAGRPRGRHDRPAAAIGSLQ